MVFQPKPNEMRFLPASVAIQGQLGSFSHEAAKNLFPQILDKAFYCCDDFEETFNKVARGDVETAVIPIENTLAGNVPYVLGLIKQKGLYIVGEFNLGVQFFLAGMPGANAMDIKEVHSHVHALAQCRGYIQRHPHFNALANPDTAGAAKLVSGLKDKTKAAICSSYAAYHYGLQILDRNIQDDKDPITRFLVYSREADIARQIKYRKVDYKTTALLKPRRKLSYPKKEILDVFHHHGFTEPRMEEYIGKNFRNEGYFIEFLGHVNSSKTKALFRDLREICTEVSTIGCYEMHHLYRFPSAPKPEEYKKA